MPNRNAVTAAEFIRNIGYWQNEALREPISITHHGRERLVLAAPTAFNVDRSKQSEQTLQVVKADQAGLLEHLEEGFLIVDANLSVVSGNAAAALFAGRAQEELRGATIFDLMPQPLASVLADRIHRLQRARKSERFEASTFDGRHLSVRVFPSASGAGILFLNTTEQFGLRRKLEHSDALDAAVQRCSSLAAMRLDARARIETADEAFCAWSGFDARDLVGHRFVDLVSAPERRVVGETIERAIRDGAGAELTLTLLGRRGEELSSLLALSPVLTDYRPTGVQALLVMKGRSENRAA